MVASPNGKSCRIANRDRNTVLLANRYFPIVSRVVPARSPLLQPPCPGSEHARVFRLLLRIEDPIAPERAFAISDCVRPTNTEALKQSLFA